MDTNKFLPIGSIVKIENNPNEIMIIGYMGYAKDKTKASSRDYIGCDSLDGFSENTYLFNKESIENVIFMGYKDQDTINNLKMIEKVYNAFTKSKSFEEAGAILTLDILNKQTNSTIVSKANNILNRKMGGKNE